MSLLSFLMPRNGLRQQPERYRFRPRLEVLEGRALPSNLVVHNTNDSGPGSLRQAIFDAASGDKIFFDDKLAGQTITLTSGQLQITKSLEIRGFDVARVVGGGHVVINGNQASRVFDIYGAGASTPTTVTLFGMTITRGFADGDGGGIRNFYGALTLSHCTILENKASGGGGGICNDEGTLTVSDSAVSRNDAQTGGGIENVGSFSGCIFAHCTLSYNSALSGGGGIAETTGALTISQSSLSNNSVTNGPGGGIDAFTHRGLTISDSTLSANSAHGEYGSGGGIWLSGGSGTLTNCILSGNSASDAGGGILFATDGGTLTNCTLSDNSAGFVGGGIYNSSYYAPLTVDHSILYGNSAEFGGGVANVSSAYTSVIIAITHSVLLLNASSVGGGGVYNGVGSVLNVLDHSNICANSAPVGADLFNAGSYTKDATSTICIIWP